MIQQQAQLTCDICGMAPAYAVETVDGRKIYLCREHMNKYRQNYEKKSVIGERFKDKTFENFIGDEKVLMGMGYNKTQARDIKKMKDIGIAFVKYVRNGEFPFLLLYGSTGSGKTHIEAAIYNELVSNVLIVYIEGDKLIHRMRDMYNDNASVEETLLEYTAPGGVVIIDDLTNIPDTATVKRGIYTIINNQYVTRSGIILSSNEEDIGYLIGEAAYDRFRVRPGAIYHTNWPSFRLRSGGK